MNSSFKVGKDAVTIMDGQDEGIFSWFTLNFLLGEFEIIIYSVKCLRVLIFALFRKMSFFKLRFFFMFFLVRTFLCERMHKT